MSEIFTEAWSIYTGSIRIGISYMYFGAWQSRDGSSVHEFHVGPHIMIVSPNQAELQGMNRDPSNGMSYVAHLPHHTELYLVMPVRTVE